MKIVLLFLLALISYAQTQDDCDHMTPKGDLAANRAYCSAGAPNGDCCECFEGVDAEGKITCEGCQKIPCTTTPKPTPQPTPQPTPKPTTTTAKPTPQPTPKPTTTTAKPTTPKPTPPPTTTTTKDCTCPPALVCTPGVTLTASTSKKGKKKKKAVGCGQGECDCDGGVVELRWKYRGAPNGVKIEIFRDGATICEFNNVVSGQQVVCNLRGGPGLVVAGKFDFENETPFIVTGPGGYRCAAQYHTSCSSDIVGVVQPECPDLVVSGWKDVGNVDGKDGGDCDDMINEVDCQCDNDPSVTTTTTTPVRIPIKIGDNCYCDTTGNFNSGTGTTTSAPATTGCSGGGGKKKKKKKCKDPKGKKGSKKKKGKKKGNGLGVGECDCEGGQTELTMLYSGDPKVDIYFYNKEGKHVCTVSDVAKGQEAHCDVTKAGEQKFGTNTFLELKKAGTQTSVCDMSVHTSCSRDIVGTYGNDGHNCGTTMVVSGWKDAGNTAANQAGCDDGLELCDCAGTVVVPENIFGGVNTEVGNGVCFCSTVRDNVISTGVTAKDALSNGFGTCTCSTDPIKVRGIKKLRFVYLPQDPLVVKDTVDIQVFYDAAKTEMVAEFVNVAAGEENEVDMTAYINPNTLRQKYTNLMPFTFFTVTNNNDDSVVSGKLNTGCFDIVGYTPNGAESIVVSGWENTENNGDCDDGFYPCSCTDCRPFDTAGGASSACAKEPGCFVNEHTNTCDTLSAALYNGSDAPKQVSLLWVIAVSAVAAFLKF